MENSQKTILWELQQPTEAIPAQQASNFFWSSYCLIFQRQKHRKCIKSCKEKLHFHPSNSTEFASYTKKVLGIVLRFSQEFRFIFSFVNSDFCTIFHIFYLLCALKNLSHIYCNCCFFPGFFFLQNVNIVSGQKHYLAFKVLMYEWSSQLLKKPFWVIRECVYLYT